MSHVLTRNDVMHRSARKGAILTLTGQVFAEIGTEPASNFLSINAFHRRIRPWGPRGLSSHPITDQEGGIDLADLLRNRIGLKMNAQCRHATWDGVAVKVAGANDNALLKADDKSQRNDEPTSDEQSVEIKPSSVLVPFKDLASFVNA